MDKDAHFMSAALYPPFEILKELPLRPMYPCPSPRYGDPKIKAHFDHYIKDGCTYPPLQLLKERSNSMLKRKPEKNNVTSSTKSYEGICEFENKFPKYSSYLINDTKNTGGRRILNGSRPLIQRSQTDFEFLFRLDYKQFHHQRLPQTKPLHTRIMRVA